MTNYGTARRQSPYWKRAARRERWDNFVGFFPLNVFLGIFVLLFAGTIALNIAHLTTPNEAVRCVVTEKDRTTNSDGASDMRVYTDNCGVLSVGDNLFTGTFNSADIYGSIEVGGTYNFELRGFRIPLFSMFPLITEVERVS